MTNPEPRSILKLARSIKVIRGPFENFSGIIEDINTEKGKIKVMVSMFGRETPVELDYHQVEKL